MVPNVLISLFQPPPYLGVMAQATTVFLWTSRPAQRRYITSMTPFPLSWETKHNVPLILNLS